MKERMFTDTALNIALFAMPFVFVATLYWVTREAPGLRTAHAFIFYLSLWALAAAKEARAEERLDEVELTAARFGARWGLLGGFAFMFFLILLPPVHPLLADIADALGRIEDRSMTGESRLFLLGGLTVFFSQLILKSVLAAAWTWAKR
jgi:hypothetical protein